MPHPFPESDCVVVVDDSAVERSRLCDVVKRIGLLPVPVASSDQALAQIHESGPLLVVLDVMMPPPNGFELCRQIRSDQSLADLPIVMCSIKATAVDRMWARRLGVHAYLSKPMESQRAQHFMETQVSRIRATIRSTKNGSSDGG